MAPYNTAIVRRSWGIFESANPQSRPLKYGENFSYEEYMTMPGAVSAFFTSVFLYFGLGASEWCRSNRVTQFLADSMHSQPSRSPHQSHSSTLETIRTSKWRWTFEGSSRIWMVRNDDRRKE